MGKLTKNQKLAAEKIEAQATLVIFQIVSVKTSIKTNLSFLFGYCDQWQIDFPDPRKTRSIHHKRNHDKSRSQTGRYTLCR